MLLSTGAQHADRGSLCQFRITEAGMDYTSRLQPLSLIIEDNPAMVITTSMPSEHIGKLIRFIRYKSKPFSVERVPSPKTGSREAENSR